MGVKKVGEGKYTLYLEECPKCGAKRDIDNDKLFKLTAISGGGMLTTAIFGAPIIGALGAIGAVKLLLAGSISAGAASHLIKTNYKFLQNLNKQDLYTCPKCGSTNLFNLSGGKI